MFGREFQARARTADKPPTQSIQTKVRTPLPLPNYTLWLWNSDISDMHPCTWPVHAALLMVVAVFLKKCILVRERQHLDRDRTWKPPWISKCTRFKWVRSSIKYENKIESPFTMSLTFFLHLLFNAKCFCCFTSQLWQEHFSRKHKQAVASST